MQWLIIMYGRLQDLILLFKFPMGKREGFVEICIQSGHAPSKKFARSVLYTPDVIISVNIIVINKL